MPLFVRCCSSAISWRRVCVEHRAAAGLAAAVRVAALKVMHGTRAALYSPFEMASPSGGSISTAFPSCEATTYAIWTSNSTSAQVGHHNRRGLNVAGSDPASWNSAHLSQGCSQSQLRSTGGDGLFYCFAVNELETAVEAQSWG